MKNWKKDLAQTILKTKVIFQFLEQREGEKCWFFFTTSPPEKKGKVGKENGLSVFMTLQM